MKAVRVAVTDTATIVAAGLEGGESNPQSFYVKNLGESSVWLGGEGVTTAEGYEFAAAEGMGIDLCGDALYAIAAAEDEVELSVLRTGN